MATTYTGRVGNIVTQVGRDINDSNLVNTTDADCLSWINQALDDLSQLGYFDKVGTVNAVATQESYVLTTLLTDFGALKGIRWASTGNKILPAGSWDDYETRRAAGLTGTPTIYMIRAGTVYFCPAPSASETGAFRVLYSPQVTHMTGTTPNDNPTTPALFDDYYVQYCMWKAFARKEADTYPRTNLKAPEYYQRMVMIRNRLVGSTSNMPKTKPYR